MKAAPFFEGVLPPSASLLALRVGILYISPKVGRLVRRRARHGSPCKPRRRRGRSPKARRRPPEQVPACGPIGPHSRGVRRRDRHSTRTPTPTRTSPAPARLQAGLRLRAAGRPARRAAYRAERQNDEPTMTSSRAVTGTRRTPGCSRVRSCSPTFSASSGSTSRPIHSAWLCRRGGRLLSTARDGGRLRTKMPQSAQIADASLKGLAED